MTKQERLEELQQLKRQHEKKIEFLRTQIKDILSMAPKQEYGSIAYMMENNRYQMLLDVRMKPLQSELQKYKELLSNVEREISKIEAMSENEAATYIRKYQLRQGTLKVLDVIMDMTPEHVSGRVYKVNDNFLKYWLIFIAIGLVIVAIVMSASN